jgi:hypothetical protein
MANRYRGAKLLCGLLVIAAIAAAGTRVRDTLFDAKGNRAAGVCVIQWGPFVTALGKAIGAGTKRYTVRNGVLDVELEVTAGAIPAGTGYAVRCSFAGSVPGPVERWHVPESESPVSLAAVRVTQTLPVPVADLNVGVADVVGLDDVLADRPVKGPNWLPFRAAVIDLDGKLAAANGALNDCVKVDGSAGPCGDGGGAPGAPGTYVANVRPTRFSDLVWKLPQAPSPASSTICFVNGLRHTYGVDYTVSGDTITWVQSHILLFADAHLQQDPEFVVTCDYWRP